MEKLKTRHKMYISDPTSDSEISTDWDNICDSASETDSHYSPRESPEISHISDSSSSDESEDLSESSSSRRRRDSKSSSSTSDTYNPSDIEDEISLRDEFYDSYSCSNPDCPQAQEKSTARKIIYCTCFLSKTKADPTSQKLAVKCNADAASEVNSSERANESESKNTESLVESKEKFYYIGQSQASKIKGSKDERENTKINQERNANSEMATKDDADNDPVKFFNEKQCWMTLDILYRLKEMLSSLISDYNECGNRLCTDIEVQLKDIIYDHEYILKKQVPPKLLESVVNKLAMENPDALQRLESSPSKFQLSSYLPSSEKNNYEHASDCESSDSDDEVEYPDEIKKSFEKFQTFTNRIHLIAKSVSHSWRKDIDDQRRRNWAESITRTAASHIEPKPGKEIDQDGLKKFGESIEWEVFHCQANSAVEYSNILCDKHYEIGHGKMTEAEHDYLMFLAYKKNDALKV